MMGIRKFFRVFKARCRFARIEREWNRSERKREIEAECEMPPRSLTLEEENLLRWILEHGSEEARSFLPQIEGMKAVRSCICGCPTIRLVVAANLPLGCLPTSRIVCDLEGDTAKGELVGVLLFQDDGKLSELEAYSIDGMILSESNEYGFPTIESLRELRFNDPAQSGL